MSKRAFLKTLAFLAGLYFVLEFFLPDKVGGAFDGYAVQSPAPVQTHAGERLLYAGLYADRLPAIGCLAPAGSAAPWASVTGLPVLRRALTVPDDLAGMRQLAAVAVDDRIELFYLGVNPAQEITLCRAAGNADGTGWRRRPPPRVFPATPAPHASRPRSQPNGQLPGALEGFAVDRTDSQWTLLLALRVTGQGLGIWQATGADPAALQLDAAPLCPAAHLPQDAVAFDARRTGAGWTLYVVSGNRLTTIAIDDAPAPRPPVIDAPRELVPADTRITALRATADTLFLSTARPHIPAPPAEFAPLDTAIVALPAADVAGAARLIHLPGAPPTPTYLSRGIGAAGLFLQILAATALFIPVINLGLFHGKKIVRRARGWHNSIIFFVCLVAMFVATLAGKGSGTGQPHSAFWRHTYDFLFGGIVQSMGTAVFSMIAFYMISAAYRSFRVRSLESVLLMVAACTVMVGQMPLGEWQASLLPESARALGLPWLSQQLLTLINACAYRGVLIGLTIGGISIAVRIWLGLDNSVYSGLEGKSR